MIFLDKTAHDSWILSELPLLSDNFYGFAKGEYNSSDTNLKSGFFPILDTINPNTNNTVFRTIVKLTLEEIPEKYDFTSADHAIISPNIASTFQVVIIQVDKNLKTVKKGHYSMNSITT